MEKFSVSLERRVVVGLDMRRSGGGGAAAPENIKLDLKWGSEGLLHPSGGGETDGFLLAYT